MELAFTTTLMVAVPWLTPVTTPDETVAMGVAELYHPPVAPGVHVSVVVSPAQTSDAPVSEGCGFTVAKPVCVDEHPNALVSEILNVPADTPVTTPVDASTVATDGLLLLHTPGPGHEGPPDSSYCVIDAPTHVLKLGSPNGAEEADASTTLLQPL